MMAIGRRAFVAGGLAASLAGPLWAAAPPVREIAKGLAFPEGLCPLAGGGLLFVEIAGGRLCHLADDGRVEQVAMLGGGPNGCAMGPDGKAYVANNGGLAFRRLADGRQVVAGVADDYRTGSIQRVDLASGRSEVLYTHCGDYPLKGPNDIAFDGGVFGGVRPAFC